jgi:hypothetical protein
MNSRTSRFRLLWLACGTIIFIIASIYVLGFVKPFQIIDRDKFINESRCRDHKMAKEECISGIVQSKYRDVESHMWKTIEFANGNNSYKSLIFRNDRSPAYEFLQKGDIITKSCDSLKFLISREGTTVAFILDYGCDERRLQ